MNKKVKKFILKNYLKWVIGFCILAVFIYPVTDGSELFAYFGIGLIILGIAFSINTSLKEKWRILLILGFFICGLSSITFTLIAKEIVIFDMLYPAVLFFISIIFIMIGGLSTQS
jgi:hypothetical protein